jgi:2-hydroxychromene-2-carboxylate isomerase
VEFVFDVGSPTTYLAWTQLPRLAREAGAEIVWSPVLLGGIFKATGNASPVTVPAKARWMLADLARAAKRLGVPMHFNPHFPVNTLYLMRGATALLGRREFEDYLTSVFTALWVGGSDLGDPGEVAAAVRRAGLDPAEFQGMIEQPEVKDRLKATTERAVSRGVFGCPTFFVGEEMFFGQDRLDDLRDALAGA